MQITHSPTNLGRIASQLEELSKQYAAGAWNEQRKEHVKRQRTNVLMHVLQHYEDKSKLHPQVRAVLRAELNWLLRKGELPLAPAVKEGVHAMGNKKRKKSGLLTRSGKKAAAKVTTERLTDNLLTNYLVM